MLLTRNIYLNDPIDFLSASVTLMLIDLLVVAFTAHVAMLAWHKYNAPGILITGGACVALDVNLVYSLSSKRWRIWNLLGCILLIKTCSYHLSYRIFYAFPKALD